MSVAGLDVSRANLHETARCVGSVFQNPKSQFYTMDTDSELAFASENQGIPEGDIHTRIAATVKLFGIEQLLNRTVSSLSGGEKQKVACAAVSVPNPPLIVMDEPSSNLDTEAIEDIRRIILSWKAAGHAVIVAEHRIYYLTALVDRVYLMEDGRIASVFSGDEFRALSPTRVRDMGLRPLHLKDVLTKADPTRKFPSKNQIIRFRDFTLWRKNRGCRRKTLDIETLDVVRGASVAIIGRNGAGKTTFARTLAGLERTCPGRIVIDDRTYAGRDRLALCFMVMQDVNHQLFTESVLDEVLLSMEEEDETKAMDVLQSLDLQRYAEVHPLSLSGGQKQRVAIACAVASKRDIIVFDEPTSGLDAPHMRDVARCMETLHDRGTTQVVVSHDPEFILSCCDHVVHLEGGRVVESYRLDGKKNMTRLLDFFFSMTGKHF